MKVKGIKRGQIIEILEKLNIPDGSEIIIEIQDVQGMNAVDFEKPREEQEPTSQGDRRQNPVFGSDRGLIWISDDFDEPLEDFKEYME